jgi:flagellar basal-body rod modification protein FlgD
MVIDSGTLARSSGLLADARYMTPASAASGSTTGGTTSATASTGAAKSADVSSAFGLGKDDFFKLFLSQLANQDPTNPMDDKAFLDQLAQFSMIDTLQQVKKALDGTQLAQASGLIGRQVAGNDVTGKAITGTVDRLVQTDGELFLMIGDRAIKPDAVSDVTQP